MVELTIESIRVSLMNYQRVVILKEKDAERYLPIWIGQAEAEAIAIKLQDVAVARPLTHDLLRSVIEQLGGTVTSVVVNDMTNDTFYAKVMLEAGGRSLEIDARPSDAIALAVRVGVPIYANETVLDRYGVQISDEEAAGAESGGAQAPVREEELERMSAFRDFIEGLDLDDFDKRKRG